MLIVTRPFGRHRKGDAITDAGEIAAVLASEHARCVVASAAPHSPAASEAEG